MLLFATTNHVVNTLLGIPLFHKDMRGMYKAIISHYMDLFEMRTMKGSTSHYELSKVSWIFNFTLVLSNNIAWYGI